MFCCCFCTFVLSSSAGLFIVCALSRDHAIFRSLSRTCFIEKKPYLQHNLQQKNVAVCNYGVRCCPYQSQFIHFILLLVAKRLSESIIQISETLQIFLKWILVRVRVRSDESEQLFELRINKSEIKLQCILPLWELWTVNHSPKGIHFHEICVYHNFLLKEQIDLSAASFN